jgi:hypothetical protein
MSLYQPATPYSDSIERPACRCGTHMMLDQIEAHADPELEKRTFACPKCGISIVLDRIEVYRVYILGEANFIGARELRCSTDGEAVERAKQLVDGHALEVWHRGIRIARIQRSGKVPRSH